MKTRIVLLNLVLIACCNIICVSDVHSQNADDIYYRTYTNSLYKKDITFIRLHDPMVYIPFIDNDDLCKGIDATSIIRVDNNKQISQMIFFKGEDDVQNTVIFDSLIFDSRENTEIYAMEMIGASTGFYVHAITIDGDAGIGDNCWYNGSLDNEYGYQMIVFTRYNIVVSLFRNNITNKYTMYNVARAIDTYLLEQSHKESHTDVLVPQIQSTEILSVDEETGGGVQYQISVNAVDPKHNILYYRVYNSRWALSTSNVVLFFTREIDPSCRIWVINDQHLVASKDIFN